LTPDAKLARAEASDLGLALFESIGYEPHFKSLRSASTRISWPLAHSRRPAMVGVETH
jgi:hypothetical protein